MRPINAKGRVAQSRHSVVSMLIPRVLDEAIPTAWPDKQVKPRSMWVDELSWGWTQPWRDAGVVCARGRDVPADDGTHHVQDGNLLGQRWYGHCVDDLLDYYGGDGASTGRRRWVEERLYAGEIMALKLGHVVKSPSRCYEIDNDVVDCACWRDMLG